MKNLLAALLAALLLALGLAGCEPSPQRTPDPPRPPQPRTEFRILAGSELRDMAELVQEFGRTQGVDVQFSYGGTLDAVDALAGGHRHDAVWVSHGKYLQLVPEVKAQIRASEKTMYSRVVLGVKPQKARELGWKSGRVSWRDVIAAARDGRFRYAMTNPTGSNTGFVALVGLAAELSGKGDALEVGDIRPEPLKALFAAQSFTSGSSGDLAERLRADPSRADGMINYESVIRGLAADGLPLEVIVPKEGVITADYPLMLLARSEQAGFYGRLVEFLRSAPTQARIAQTTHRTPLSGSDDGAVVNELPFPASLAVVDAILRGYLDDYSQPAKSHFVLDVSGSMRGERLAAMKAAMRQLTQPGAAGSGRFAVFRAREEITVTPFSNLVLDRFETRLDGSPAANAEKLARLGERIDALQADGGTAIYSALAQAYPRAQREMKAEDSTVSIVLLTDGENRHGMPPEEFAAFVRAHGEPRVPVFAILFGEASESRMGELAQLTRGGVFDARRTPLPQVMKLIRTYQ